MKNLVTILMLVSSPAMSMKCETTMGFKKELSEVTEQRTGFIIENSQGRFSSGDLMPFMKTDSVTIHQSNNDGRLFTKVETPEEISYIADYYRIGGVDTRVYALCYK